MRKVFVIISFIFFSAFLAPAFADASSISGFIPGQIWYSKSELIEGDTVNIYTAVWNSDKNPLSVKVEFYDKNVILGTREVTLSPSELKSVSVPWKITLGDHVISAKIVSSLENISGTKEKVVLENDTTENDRKTVKVTISKDDGSVNSPAEDVVKTQIEATTEEIKNIIPESVSDTVSGTVGRLDDFRNESYVKVSDLKSNAKEEVKLSKDNNTKEDSKNDNQIKDAVDNPLAYVKLFLFSVATFILGSKLIFYALLVFLVFIILRAIYRGLRHRR